MHDQVSCPKCGNEFAVGEALRDQLESRMRVQMKDELQRALDEAKRRSDEELTNRIAAVDRDLADARKRADEATAKEVDLLRKQRELEDRETNAALEFEQKLATERTSIVDQAEKTARARFEVQSKAEAERVERERTIETERVRHEAELARAQMQSELATARQQAVAATAKEADLLRMQRELEDRAANAAIDLAQKLAAERGKVVEQAEQAARARFDAQAAEAEQVRKQMESDLVVARKRADDATANETNLLRMRRELEERASNAALEFEQKLATERSKVLAQAEQVARARFEVQAKAEAERSARENAIEVERVRLETDHARAQMQSELAAAKKRAEDAAVKEIDLLHRQRDLEDREANAGVELEQKLAAERAKVKAEAERVVEERMKLHSQQQLEDLRRENDSRFDLVEKDLVEARKRADAAALKEVELLRKQHDLNDARRALAFDTEKRLLEERKTIQEQSDGQAAQRIALIQDQTRLREKEQEEKTAQLQRTVDQLQQRLTQGAQQAQGEAQELVLKDILIEAFVEDCIEDVAKGVRGADLVQRVHTPGREECGIILWESKRTQAWSAGWLEKMRDDQREISAVCAVIVTQALPPGVKNFGILEGVWVCGWSYASALGAALRAGINDVHQARRSTDGRDTKMHLLYEYLIGHEFRNRIEGVIESIVSMQDELRSEERAYARIWKKRATTMNRALTQMSSVYGSLQSIVGAKLEDITPLALPGTTRSLGSSDEEDADDDDADDPDHAGVSVSPELEFAMFALIPADGTPVGNLALRNALATKMPCTEAEFLATKSALLAKGYVKKGKGRGGSVSRVVTAEHPIVRDQGAA